MFLRNTLTFFKYKDVAALGFLFSTNSLMIGIWAASLPFIITRLSLTDGQLGLMLLLGPMGALTGVLISTKVYAKLPVSTWLGRGNMVYTILILGEILTPYTWLFGTLLYFRGLFGFLNGVALNAVVGKLEDKHGRRFMSTCHAMYSVGGGVGAGFAALFYAFGLDGMIQGLAMATMLVSVILYLRPFYEKHHYLIHSKSSFVMPNGPVLGLALICLVLFMTEGAIVDWSSIYLKRVLEVPVAYISLGYGLFAVAMTLMRLNGDALIPRLGQKNIVMAGTAIAALGIGLVSYSNSLPMALIGFICTGIGCSCIVPVLFSSAGRIEGVSQVQGFAMVTSGGLIGFLAGPSIIGFISDHFNLNLGFRFVVILLILAMITAWKNKAL